MNREEWVRRNGRNYRKYNKYYKQAQKLLMKWRVDNNIPANVRCVIHHIDNEQNAVKYNEIFYERWGFDEDGTFTHGKYVQFMTASEHIAYHNTHRELTQETHVKMSMSHKGKLASEETRAKMSAAQKGRIISEETRAKMSAAQKGRVVSEETRAKMSTILTGRKLTQETIEKLRVLSTGENNPMWGRKHSESSKAKMRVKQKAFNLLWNVYKNNSGTKSWHEFMKAVKSGDITFEMQPISVFINQ